MIEFALQFYETITGADIWLFSGASIGLQATNDSHKNWLAALIIIKKILIKKHNSRGFAFLAFPLMYVARETWRQVLACSLGRSVKMVWQQPTEWVLFRLCSHVVRRQRLLFSLFLNKSSDWLKPCSPFWLVCPVVPHLFSTSPKKEACPQVFFVYFPQAKVTHGTGLHFLHFPFFEDKLVSCKLS